MAQNSSGETPNTSGDDGTAPKGAPLTLEQIDKEVSDVAREIRALENKPPPAGDEKATAAWQNKLNRDWETVTTAVNFEMRDDPDNPGIKIDADNAARIALDTLSKVKNDTPQAESMMDAFNSAVISSRNNDVREETLDLLSQGLKAAEKNPATAADSTHGFTAAQRGDIMDNYIGELNAAQNLGGEEGRTAMNSLSRLLASPEMKNARDTGKLWDELSQLTSQVSNTISDSQGGEKLQFRRLDLRLAVQDLDQLSASLPAGDTEHRNEVQGLLRDDLYRAALNIKQELVDANIVKPDWGGDDKPGIIQRFEVQDAPGTPTASTAGAGAKPSSPDKGPQV